MVGLVLNNKPEQIRKKSIIFYDMLCLIFGSLNNKKCVTKHLTLGWKLLELSFVIDLLIIQTLQPSIFQNQFWPNSSNNYNFTPFFENDAKKEQKMLLFQVIKSLFSVVFCNVKNLTNVYFKKKTLDCIFHDLKKMAAMHWYGADFCCCL